MPRFPAGQTLLIDADDTLWENNIYFERAIAAFIGFLDHREYSAAEVRQTLNAVERDTILTHGYGLSSFTRSLVDCFERLSTEPVTEEKRERVRGFARTIAEQEIELLPGVKATLADLAARHRLILMTKGDHAEQADKLARSGLAEHTTLPRTRRRAEVAQWLVVRGQWLVSGPWPEIESARHWALAVLSSEQLLG